MAAAASKYRDRIEFLSQTAAGSDGMGGTLPGTETVVATVYALVVAKTGQRSLMGSSLSFEAYTKITVRGRLDFVPTTLHRVRLANGRTLTIQAVTPEGAAREEMVITAIGDD